MNKMLKSINTLRNATDQKLMSGANSMMWSINQATGWTKSQVANSLIIYFAVAMPVGITVALANYKTHWWLPVAVGTTLAYTLGSHGWQLSNAAHEKMEIKELKDGIRDPKIEARDKSLRAYGFDSLRGTAVVVGINAAIYHYHPLACNYVFEIALGVIAISPLFFNFSTYVMRTDYLPPQDGSIRKGWRLIKSALRRNPAKQTETNLEDEKRE